MTISVTLGNLANLTNENTAVSTINNNSALITTGFTSALDTQGDQMLGTLDMNSNQIINLPSPGTNNSPVRLTDLTNAMVTGTVVLPTVIGGTNITTSGTGTITISTITSPVFTSVSSSSFMGVFHGSITGAVTGNVVGNITGSITGPVSTSSFNATGTSVMQTLSASSVYLSGPSPWADVKSFGAIGNNSHDDTSSIQATIYSLTSSNGGVAFFPQGNYKATSTITVPATVNLVGLGVNTTLLNFSSMTATGIVFSSSCSYGHVEKIGIVGNTSTGTVPLISIPAGVINMVFRDCNIELHPIAVQYAGSDCVFENCFITGNVGGVLSTGAGWYRRVKFDTSGSSVGYAVTHTTATTTAESYYEMCDFSGAYSTAPIVIADTAEQTIVGFTNSVIANITGSSSSANVNIIATGGKWVNFLGCEFGGFIGTSGVFSTNTTSSPLLSIVGCWSQTAFTGPTTTQAAVVKSGNINIT